MATCVYNLNASAQTLGTRIFSAAVNSWMREPKAPSILPPLLGICLACQPCIQENKVITAMGKYPIIVCIQ